MMLSENPPLAMPRTSLPPNLYSGAVLLGQHFLQPRTVFRATEATKGQRTKIYVWQGRFYVVPTVSKAPPMGVDWKWIGKQRSRDIYLAMGYVHS